MNIDDEMVSPTATELYIQKADAFHGGKYTYEKTIYIKAKDKVIITCPKHGDFEQKAADHAGRYGCKHCGNNVSPFDLISGKKIPSSQLEIFLHEAYMKHGEKFSYDKVVYKDNKTDVIISCPEHGEYNQTPSGHLSGTGCRECGVESSISKSPISNTEEFIQKAIIKHGNICSYEKSIYAGSKAKLTITCSNSEHGDFDQIPNDHLDGHGCPLCANESEIGEWEREIADYVKSIYFGEILCSDRMQISPKELDIYLPEFKIGIECNGMYWHSTDKKNKNYHVLKRKSCKNAGIRLISIWEDEWVTKQQQVKDYLRNIVIQPELKHYARKLEIKHVPIHEQRKFLDNNHFQGHVGNTVCLGLYCDLELIQLMSLTNKRDRLYEIGRLCTKRSNVVIGGSERLFKALKLEINDLWDTIISYNDLDKFTGEIYGKLGMKCVSESEHFFFFKKWKRIFRRRIRKIYEAEFGKIEDGEEVSQKIMAKKLKWYTCYTSGVSKFELKH